MTTGDGGVVDLTEEDREHNVGLAFGLTMLAGACTGIGSVIVAIKYDIGPKATGGILALSAGVMVFVSFVEIYMVKSIEAFKAYFDESMDEEGAMARSYQVSMASFFGGLIITMFMNWGVHWIHERCAKGEAVEAEKAVEAAEHSAEEPHQEMSSKKSVDQVSLMKSGIITAVAIALHNFPEGLATFMAALVDKKLGAAMAVAIAIHNIPEGMAVALPIFKATRSRWKAILLGTLSGLTEPIGGIFGYLVVVNTGMSDLTYAILFGIVSGMMVFISVEELLPLALRYDPDNICATKMFYVGMAIIGLSLVLFTI